MKGLKNWDERWKRRNGGKCPIFPFPPFVHGCYINLETELTTSSATFLIDLTKNLKVKRKDQNDYTDTVDFAYDIEQFDKISLKREDLKKMLSYADRIKSSTLYIEFKYSLEGDKVKFPVKIVADPNYFVLEINRIS